MADDISSFHQMSSQFRHPPRPLVALIEQIITVGNLVFIDGATGARQRFGNGTGPQVTIGLTSKAAIRIAGNPDLALGEAFMEGSLAILEGDLRSLFDLLFRNEAVIKMSRTTAGRLRLALTRRMQQANNRRASLCNVAHHYDLSDELYRRFLARPIHHDL